MDKNYYKIMGLSSDASEKDIKAAYRRLARKYHPDISKEPHAEERFKEMGEAYEVLKDKTKRKEYDLYLKNKAFRQSHEGQHSARQGQAGHTFSGDSFDADLFASLFGQYQNQPRPGQDYEGKITISLEEAFHGAVKSVQFPYLQGSETKMQNLKIKIPAGVKSGQRIRLAGLGAPGMHGGTSGDLYLTVTIMKHPVFDLMDNDIYLNLPITPWEAALGATIKVPTLAGNIDLKIPPSSQGGQKLRIKHRGLPGTPPGNQYVLLKINTPPATTQAAKELYQKMEAVMPFNPRQSKEQTHE